MIRVFLVDDHEIVRRGIAELIDAEKDLEVVGESADAAHTLGRIRATSPDVVVLDVRLPDGNGIDLCREVRSAHPEIHCIILTAYDDDEASRSAVLAGASGYVLKDIRGQRLVESIRRIGAGELPISAYDLSAMSFSAAQPTMASASRVMSADTNLRPSPWMISWLA